MVFASLGLGGEILSLFLSHEVDDDCLWFVYDYLVSIGLPLGTALHAVSATRTARTNALNSSKNSVEDLLVGAAVHHRAELARFKTALSARGSEIERGILCHITCELMHDPVVTTDGNSYKRASL